MELRLESREKNSKRPKRESTSSKAGEGRNERGSSREEKAKVKESLMINWLAGRQIARISMRHCDVRWVNK